MSEYFHKLFIFEMANNHQGSVEHGKRIIDAMADIAKKHSIRAGIKFQFRDLDTFIHPRFRNDTNAKHISRFLGTRLSREQFQEMIAYARSRGLLAISTPFDEASVDQCTEQDIDIIKVASCSAMDWPLLDAVSRSGKPVIISTAGVQFSDIDKIVSFFSHRGVTFAVLHCVGMYPAPDTELNLDIIPRMIKRYPAIPIGYSGHEAPDNTHVAIAAVSKGAMLLERHVGVPTDGATLNAYSMNPQQTDAWVQAAKLAWEMAGSNEKIVPGGEAASLRSLMRGTYARTAIKAGQVLRPEDVYFAMPVQEGQLTSGEFGGYRAVFAASRDYAPDEPIYEVQKEDPVLLAREVIHQAQGMLNEAGIHVGDDSTIELSHHYGMERFREVGAVIVNIINREYCKKLIIMLPGQRHPLHQHERKEETFELLSGDLEVQLDGAITRMIPGDRLLVKRNSSHSFFTKEGAIFEEISTTHYKGDSFYEDKEISALDPMQRKTVVASF